MYCPSYWLVSTHGYRGVYDSRRLYRYSVFAFSFDCDRLGLALLCFICECHCYLYLWEINRPLSSIERCGVFTQECESYDGIRGFARSYECFVEAVVSYFELHRIGSECWFKLFVGIFYLEGRRKCFACTDWITFGFFPHLFCCEHRCMR